jgi:hypothetical protein
MARHNTVWQSTIQYGKPLTIQHKKAQYSTGKHNIAQYSKLSKAPYNMAKHHTMAYITANH